TANRVCGNLEGTKVDETACCFCFCFGHQPRCNDRLAGHAGRAALSGSGCIHRHHSRGRRLRTRRAPWSPWRLSTALQLPARLASWSAWLALLPELVIDELTGVAAGLACESCRCSTNRSMVHGSRLSE